MPKKEMALQVLLEQKLLPLYYHESAEVSVATLQALYDAGVRTVEYTNRGEAALTNFKALRNAVDTGMKDLLLGIGTIKNEEQAQAYIDAGADYIVCPSVNVAVGAVAQVAGLLWIPGCMTPTEIASAENAGATLVKIFPGNLLGPSYIESIKDLFPNLKFLVTGGVEAKEENLKNWFGSGLAGVGMGSKLITKEAISSGNYKQITDATKHALQLVKEVSQRR